MADGTDDHGVEVGLEDVGDVVGMLLDGFNVGMLLDGFNVGAPVGGVVHSEHVNSQFLRTDEYWQNPCRYQFKHVAVSTISRNDESKACRSAQEVGRSDGDIVG